VIDAILDSLPIIGSRQANTVADAYERDLNLFIGVHNGQISLRAAEELVAEQRNIDAIHLLRDLIEYHEGKRYQNSLRNQPWEEPQECKTAREMIGSILAARRSE
jgi:hypothetical protein